MEGLDCSEVCRSDLESTNRLDAEFYRTRLVDLDKRLASQGASTLGGLCDFVAGPFGSEFHVENYTGDSGYRYIRGKDVKPFFIEENDNVYIPTADFNRLSEFKLKEGDILLSVVGTLGHAAIVTADNLPSIFSCKSTVLRSRKEDPWFLISYINSAIGQNLLLRRARGTVQPGLNLQDVKSLSVPRISATLKAAIGRCTRASYEQLIAGRGYQEKAEHSLLETLKLSDWHPPMPLAYTRLASESFAAQRLDAQYFAPRFEALRGALEDRFKVRELGGIGEVLKGSSVQYYEDGSIPIIRSGDLDDISNDSRFLCTRPIEGIFELKRGDVLISSIGFGSIGKAQVFDKPGRYGTVSEVTVVRQRQLNPYYLAFFLRSSIGQMQIERFITGATGQLHLYPSGVARVFVPIIPASSQGEFQALAERSQAARNRARALLEHAKRAVELAIEQNDNVALQYLNNPI